jgi:hypothetical protein
MRYAAQLEGRPAAELLAYLPPLPPDAVEMPAGCDRERNAMDQVVSAVYLWPYLMRCFAEPGQDFLLRLPGALAELPPSLVHPGLAVFDAEAHVDLALDFKERGNALFVAGDTRGALVRYTVGIDSLRALTALHLQHNSGAIAQAVNSLGVDPRSSEDPATAVAWMRHQLLPAVNILMLPYEGQDRAALMREMTTPLFDQNRPLPINSRLPGCRDMPSLIACFWKQLTAKFMEPYGGVEGLLANPQAWTHHHPNMHDANKSCASFF